MLVKGLEVLFVPSSTYSGSFLEDFDFLATTSMNDTKPTHSRWHELLHFRNLQLTVRSAQFTVRAQFRVCAQLTVRTQRTVHAQFTVCTEFTVRAQLTTHNTQLTI